MSSPGSAGRELDARALGRALWRKKLWIVVPTVIAVALTAVVVNVLTPRYKSEARILFDGRENIFMRPEADKAGGERSAADPETMSSQVQLVLSRGVAMDVIRKLKLNERPEFDPALAGNSTLHTLLLGLGVSRDPLRTTPEERVLESYYARLTAYAVEKSRVITVEFSSADPDLAARVTNAITESYLGLQQVARQEQNRAASQWLSGEIDTLRQKVMESEAKVETFRGKTNLLLGNNNTNLSAQQLGELNSQLSAVRGQKSELETRAGVIKDMLKRGNSIEASEILNSDSIRRLSDTRATLRGQLAEQSSTLLDNHPRIKELKAQIADLDRQIRAEAERLVRSLEIDAKIAGARVDNLAGALDQMKRQASSTNEEDVQLRALERESKAQRDLLESYLAKYREATARDSLGSAPSDARVISRAAVSNTPFFPKKLPMILVAALGAMVIASGFVATGELLRAQPSAAPELVRDPASAPPAASRPAPAPDVFGLAIETIDGVARNLHLAGNAGSRVAVFGATGNVGTSLIAIALARSLARNARTVLIDLGLQAPNLAAISSDPNAPGIADAVRGAASFGDIVTRDRMSRLHLVTAGRIGEDTAAILASPRLTMTIDALARNYDHVIVDAGAAAAADVKRIAELAPRAALVVSDATPAELAEARQRLAGYADVMVLAGAQSAAPQPQPQQRSVAA